MRCSQCGYTTFDYLEACPKCRADFYEDRSRLNLPTGPARPISLKEIMDRVESPSSPPAEITPALEEKTIKLRAPESSGPKTFDLDLSDDTSVESLSDKWMAQAGGIPEKKGGELSLNLSLE